MAKPPVLICTPNTGSPVLGVLLYRILNNSRFCAGMFTLSCFSVCLFVFCSFSKWISLIKLSILSSEGKEPPLIVNCGATLFEIWICDTSCWRLLRLAFTSSLLFSTAFLTSFLPFTPRNSSSEKSGRAKRTTQMINTVLIILASSNFSIANLLIAK